VADAEALIRDTIGDEALVSLFCFSCGDVAPLRTVDEVKALGWFGESGIECPRCHPSTSCPWCKERLLSAQGLIAEIESDAEVVRYVEGQLYWLKNQEPLKWVFKELSGTTPCSDEQPVEIDLSDSTEPTPLSAMKCPDCGGDYPTIAEVVNVIPREAGS